MIGAFSTIFEKLIGSAITNNVNLGNFFRAPFVSIEVHLKSHKSMDYFEPQDGLYVHEERVTFKHKSIYGPSIVVFHQDTSSDLHEPSLAKIQLINLTDLTC